MIAFDVASEAFSNSAQTLAWSHTCSGANRRLWVAVMTLSGRSVSTVTFNGTNLTALTRSAGGQPVQLWFLDAPSTGTHSIVVSIGTPNSYIYAAAASYTGVRQTGTADSQNTQSVVGSSVSTSVTTVEDNSWVILCARNDSSGDTNASTNSTERAAGASGTVQLYDSNSPVTPAGSFSMTVTNGGSYQTTIAMASFAPVSNSPVPVRSSQFTMLGVG